MNLRYVKAKSYLSLFYLAFCFFLLISLDLHVERQILSLCLHLDAHNWAKGEIMDHVMVTFEH